MIRSFIQHVLLEGKIQDLEKKYPDVDVETLSNNDPSPTKKYLEWMCKRYAEAIKSRRIANLLNDMFPTIAFFHKNIHHFKNKDINSYKTVKELEDQVKEIGQKLALKDLSNVSGNAVKLFEDENFLFLRPDDKNAVMKYGAGTKWCITMKNATYYEDYTEEGVVFYFLIVKPLNNYYHKIAWAVHRSNREITDIEYFDAEDNPRKFSHIDDYVVASLVETNPELEPLTDKLGTQINQFNEMASTDAPKRPLPMLKRLKSGERVPDDELLNHWNKTFNEEERFNDRSNSKKITILGKIPYRQQKLIATVDRYAANKLNNGKHFLMLGGACYASDAARILNNLFTKFVREGDGKIFYTRMIPFGEQHIRYNAESEDGEMIAIDNPKEDTIVSGPSWSSAEFKRQAQNEKFKAYYE